MNYVKDSDKTIHSIFSIRELFPNMSIPDGADLSDIGYLKLIETLKPDAPEGKIAVETNPVKVSNHYEQVWSIVDMTAEQIADQQAATVAVYERALDDHLDSVARSYRFLNGRVSLALRAGYQNHWQALGVAFGEWMDTCNLQAAGLMADVIAGRKSKPTIEAFIAGLPVFTFAG